MAPTKDGRCLSWHLQLIANDEHRRRRQPLQLEWNIFTCDSFFLKVSESHFHTADTLFGIFLYFFFAPVFPPAS